jgi:hypothetical protein
MEFITVDITEEDEDQPLPSSEMANAEQGSTAQQPQVETSSQFTEEGTSSQSPPKNSEGKHSYFNILKSLYRARNTKFFCFY